jgi:pyruvate dehydrogenase E2 component (dihydrolipoamide acetyltransferase)
MGALVSIQLPDIGDFEDVEVIEVMVKPGDKVKVDDSLITIESDKASMEVPATEAGVVKELKVKVGDRVSEGSLIIVVEKTDESGEPAKSADGVQPEPQRPIGASPSAQLKAATASPKLESVPQRVASQAPPAERPKLATSATVIPLDPATEDRSTEDQVVARKPHASPAVRKFARELGVDLAQVKGSGMNRRIFRSDVQTFIKTAMAQEKRAGASTSFELIAWPKTDFARFGAIERKPLSRIRRLAKSNLARNWVMIPHVTQFDEADLTDLEAFRQEINRGAKDGLRATILAFVLKALVAALREFPDFNSSLEGDDLILKKYFHLGFAADTPDGLIVPVIRDVDKKGVTQIARETGSLAAAAREGKLRLGDIQGGCFTVSSLGGIGGTAFTPIINAPEVAILGISKLATRPVWRDGAFVPRLMLPLSLSYDHRAIDGAEAARFTTYLAAVLSDMRRALL